MSLRSQSLGTSCSWGEAHSAVGRARRQRESYRFCFWLPGRTRRGGWDNSLSLTKALTRQNTSFGEASYQEGIRTTAISSNEDGIPRAIGPILVTRTDSRLYSKKHFEELNAGKEQSRRRNVKLWGMTFVSLIEVLRYAPYIVEIFGILSQFRILVTYSTLKRSPFFVNKGATFWSRSLKCSNVEHNFGLTLIMLPH